MKRSDIDKTLNRLNITRSQIESFCIQRRIDLLVLFGSFAKGSIHPSSDLDLAVKSTSSRLDHLQLIADLNQFFGERFFIDLVLLKPDTGIILKHEIFSGGMPLFEKKKGMFVDEAFRAWLGFQEARPLLQRTHQEFMKRFWKEWRYVA